MGRFRPRLLVIAVLAVLAVPLWVLLGVPELEKLSVDEGRQVEFAGLDSVLTPGEQTIGTPFPIKNVLSHQVLAGSGDVLVIQANMLSRNAATGEIFWEAKELMGVDRVTRQHVTGFGDRNRDGYFTFPPHVDKKNYELWYPSLLTKGVWAFDREEVLAGLSTYVFTFSVKEVPSSELFPQHSPTQVNLDTWGTFWVEPVSGRVIKWEEAWDGHFFERGRKGQSVEVGHMTYTPETIAGQAQIARRERALIGVYERWVPVLLTLLAVASSAVAVGRIWSTGPKEHEA